jgi:hypothetical protein
MCALRENANVGISISQRKKASKKNEIKIVEFVYE